MKYKNLIIPVAIAISPILIFMAIVAGYNYFSSKQPQFVEERTDSHGCLISSGYSWCEAKQKCIKMPEEYCNGLSSTTTVKADKAYISETTIRVNESSKTTITTTTIPTPATTVAIQTPIQSYPKLSFTPQISSSANHTCVALSPNNIKCWGDNEVGQLGNGKASDSPVHIAVSVIGINDVVKITAGGLSTCALLKDSSIKCWGFVYPESSSTYHYYTSPTSLFDLNKVLDISVGLGHICVLINDNTVQCWGYNEEGELGDGTNDYKKEPTPVKNLSGVISLSLGYSHSCALLEDKTVKCWGDNEVGQLGNGTTTSSNIPVAVKDLSDVKEISAGGWHTCALLNNGVVKCWGRNYAGEVGDGTTNEKLVPVLVKGLENDKVKKVVTGGFRSCALLADSTVKCWGEGYSADGRTVDFAYQAKTVLGLNNVQDVAVGKQHTCVLLTDNSAKCWGLNTYGQIGEGTFAYYVIEPTTVVGL